MASKIIIQIIIQGTSIFSRAFVAAYSQALQNAKAGGAAAQPLTRASKHKMQPDEALQILDIQGRKNLNPELLAARYTKLFEANDPKKGGSFYLQSKIYRAKEALDTELSEEKKKGDAKEGNNGEGKEEGKKQSGSH